MSSSPYDDSGSFSRRPPAHTCAKQHSNRSLVKVGATPVAQKPYRQKELGPLLSKKGLLMRIAVTKYDNHKGWYVGRPLKFLGLLVLGFASTVFLYLLGLLLHLANLPGQFALLLIPLPVGFLAFQHMIPACRGASIAYTPPFRFMHQRKDYYDDPLLVVKRSDQPGKWMALLLLDGLLWFSVPIAQFVFLYSSGALKPFLHGARF